MNITIVLGKNFGDEGKGLATDHFAYRAQISRQSCLVIRFNGGAQAGHTVDLRGRRFVFRQLSSGSFRGADTFWADPFLPDLYKLREEAASFAALHGSAPRILADGACRCVTVDDVLVNMALERSRGKARHGSCGMGINEAVVRSDHPAFRLTLAAVRQSSAEALFCELKRLRRDYALPRLYELGLTPGGAGEFGELLTDDNVLLNAAEEMCRGAALAELTGPQAAKKYDAVIFEGAQGLLLDENYTAFAPHLTSSRTGSYHPRRLCADLFPGEKPTAVYVTRTYVTRHGQGPLPHEEAFDRARYAIRDETNVPNEWQGSLRFAPHGDPAAFLAPVLADLDGADLTPSLLLTHLNETRGRVCTAAGELSVEDWCEAYDIRRHFAQVRLSASPYAEEISLFF